MAARSYKYREANDCWRSWEAGHESRWSSGKPTACAAAQRQPDPGQQPSTVSPVIGAALKHIAAPNRRSPFATTRHLSRASTPSTHIPAASTPHDMLMLSGCRPTPWARAPCRWPRAPSPSSYHKNASPLAPTTRAHVTGGWPLLDRRRRPLADLAPITAVAHSKGKRSGPLTRHAFLSSSPLRGCRPQRIQRSRDAALAPPRQEGSLCDRGRSVREVLATSPARPTDLPAAARRRCPCPRV